MSPTCASVQCSSPIGFPQHAQQPGSENGGAGNSLEGSGGSGGFSLAFARTLAQRAVAALRALSLRAAGLSLAAVVSPPIRPAICLEALMALPAQDLAVGAGGVPDAMWRVGVGLVYLTIRGRHPGALVSNCATLSARLSS